MAGFPQGLGIQWGRVQGATLPIRLQDGEVVLVRLDAVRSVQGPPYVELVRGVTDPSGTPWQASATFSPAHIGFAVTNLAAHSDALVAAGFPRIATVDVPGQSAAGLACHPGPGDIPIGTVEAALPPPAAGHT